MKSVSVLFSEPKIPQCSSSTRRGIITHSVSVLFSEPKIPQSNSANGWRRAWRVSVLFSEPKIPQWMRLTVGKQFGSVRFSALQRAENSSIENVFQFRLRAKPFQCSSASRKFLNTDDARVYRITFRFQCSSASRKFLNLISSA